MAKKPPLGLTPKTLWLEDRLKDVDGAIGRRLGSSHAIPRDWFEEREWLLDEIESNPYGQSPDLSMDDENTLSAD